MAQPEVGYTLLQKVFQLLHAVVLYLKVSITKNIFEFLGLNSNCNALLTLDVLNTLSLIKSCISLHTYAVQIGCRSSTLSFLLVYVSRLKIHCRSPGTNIEIKGLLYSLRWLLLYSRRSLCSVALTAAFFSSALLLLSALAILE